MSQHNLHERPDQPVVQSDYVIPSKKKPKVSLTRGMFILSASLILVIGLVLGGVIGGAIADSKQPSSPNGFQGGPGGMGGPQGIRGQNDVNGTIKSIGDNSLVITASDGDWTVSITSDTQLGGPNGDFALSDLAAGDQVVVIGQKDTSAKTVTAQRIFQGGQMSGGQQSQSSL